MIVFAFAALLWSFRVSGPIDLRFDAGVYYVLGTSLAEGKGYRLGNEPGAPLAIQYPPALPVFVALHQRALGTSDPVVVGKWLKRSFAAMHLTLALATFLLARAILPEPAALVATLFSLVQLNGYYLSNLLFTELPYTLVSVCLALVLLSGRLKSQPGLREMLGFILAVAGFALRTAGLALLAAWVAEALIRRRWRTAALRVGLTLLAFLSWQGYVRSVQQSEGYRHPAYSYQRAPYQFYNVSYAENVALLDPFQPELGGADSHAWLTRIGKNLALLPVGLAEAASEAQGFWSGAVKTVFYPGQKKVAWLDQLAVVPLAIVTIVLGFGLLGLVQRRVWFTVLVIAFSVGLTCVTPWPGQFSRYFAPIAPFLAITLVTGVLAIRERIGRVRRPLIRRSSWAVAGMIGLGFCSAHTFAAMNSYRSMTRVAPVSVSRAEWSSRRWFYYDRSWADWDRAVDWINRNAPHNAIVATSAPHLCYLMTGRQAVFPPMESNPAQADKLMRLVPIAYVLIDEFEFLDIARRYAEPVVIADSENWKLVHRFNNTSLYERVSVRTGRPNLPSGVRDQASE